MRPTLVFMCIFSILFSACGKKVEKAEPAPPVISDDQLLETASVKLIDRFSRELKNELMTAINEGGAQNAITVCREMAPQIAAANSGEFWSIKRVTDKNRNPDNLATEHEMVIMAKFAETTPPAVSVAEWIQGDSARTYRYYQPIRVGQLCLKCHGSSDTIDSKVKMVLRDEYPDDKAVDYRLGDLRGMFVVEVRWPDGRPFAERIVADTAQ